MRIILADDSQYIRTAYKRVLETQSHFEVVGVAEDGEEAVQKAKELQPDVAVLDVRMTTDQQEQSISVQRDELHRYAK